MNLNQKKIRDHTREKPHQVNLDKDHTGERPYHSDDLDCDFEDFENDSHTISMASMSGEITNLDYSSDATTVSYNTLDLEAVDWSSADEMDSMDSLEREKMFERVFAGYISTDSTTDSTESLDLVDDYDRDLKEC